MHLFVCASGRVCGRYTTLCGAVAAVVVINSVTVILAFQSRQFGSGVKLLKFQVVFPPNGTAALNGSWAPHWVSGDHLIFSPPT